MVASLSGNLWLGLLAAPIAGLLVYRFDGPLFFANGEYFAERVREALDSNPGFETTVVLDMEGIESIALIAEKNPVPLVASFDLGTGAQGFVSTRIKMGKTGDVVAVVKSGGKLYSARKGVKVTIGGCGG